MMFRRLYFLFIPLIILPGFIYGQILSKPAFKPRDGSVKFKKEEFSPFADSPVFYFTFKELHEIESYRKAVVEVEQFAKFKKAPFEIENTNYYNPSLYFTQIDSMLKKKEINLPALRYYIDAKSPVKLESRYEEYEGSAAPYEVTTALPYQYIYQPFFILTHEVSNVEYREFIEYVWDSIARTLLAKSGLAWAKQFGTVNETTGELTLNYEGKIRYGWGADDEMTETLEPIFLRATERFQYRYSADTRKLNYSFTLHSGGTGFVVNIFPDTLVWINDLFYNEQLCNLKFHTNLYRWHPYYDFHPVVGLSFIQVKTFLHWKTQKLQREIDKKGLPYLVEFDVPNEVELDMIRLTNALNTKNIKTFNEKNFVDRANHFSLDLILNKSTPLYNPEAKQKGQTPNAMKLYNDYCFKSQSLDKGVFPTSGTKKFAKGYAKKRQKKFNKLSKYYFKTISNHDDLPYLNSNVSEWMHETLTGSDTLTWTKSGKKIYKDLPNYSFTFPFKGNFQDYYLLYIKSKKARQAEGSDVLNFDAVKYTVLDSAKTTNDVCKMVRGCNWLSPAEPVNGNLRKNFISVDSSYSTVGFRYVVRFKKKP
jgi:hypothetical protein